MYGKVFEQILDSSIADDYLTRFVFEDFIILADQDGNVDMTLEAFSRRTNVPLEIVRAAVAKLEKPDPRSRTPDEDGRRLVRLDSHRDWGWHLVNHAKYRGMKSEGDRRTYMREYMRDRRKHGSLREFTKVDSASVSVSASEEKRVQGEEGARQDHAAPANRRKFDAAAIPESLSAIEGFAAEWSAWMEARAVKAKTRATTRAQELPLRTLAQRPGQAVAAVQRAIKSNWTGFEWVWMDRATGGQAPLVNTWHSDTEAAAKRRAAF